MKKFLVKLFIFSLLFHEFLGISLLQSQEKKSSFKNERIRVDVKLVIVPVIVEDPFTRVVTGLQRENFRVFENKTEVEIMNFGTEEGPISIGIIFDISGSMTSKKFKAAVEALVQFLKTSNPPDEFFIVTFSDRAQLISNFTQSVENIQSKMLYMAPKGQTALLDGIYLGLTNLKNAQNSRKILLIISDGGDNHSRYNERDVKHFLKESDVQIYAIGVYDPAGFRYTPEEIQGPALLKEITELTGGRAFETRNINDLSSTIKTISAELRNQYIIGYKPLESIPCKEGEWRKIKIKLVPPKGVPPLTVRAKTGYLPDCNNTPTNKK